MAERGGIVDGLADRNGRRQKGKQAEQPSRIPSIRPKLPTSFENLGIHSDLRSVAWEMLANEKSKFLASRAKNE